MIDAVDEFRKLTVRTQRPSVRAEPELVYRSDSMRELVRAAEGIASMDAPVLITGETGVGKDVLAHFIHRLSMREGSFVPLNCAAVPSSLIESELFGYAKGAFTGANADKKGLFLSADNGTLFLDEIGNMPLDMQAKLLRVLEESRIRPVGSTKQINVNVRILSATNRDLKYEVEQGRFRKDLFYRINAITIKIPPLRDRREDIPALIEHFIKESDKEFEIEENALHVLIQYDWPGNVRELESEITHLVVVSEGRIEKSMLKKEIQELREPSPASGTLQDMERNLIKEVLEKTGYNKQKTARLLGIAKSTLYEKMRRFKIDSTELKPRSKTGR
jgi:transcriptional regulator with PAS, ATPase and Fis domain